MFHIKNYQLNMTLIINILLFAIVSSIPCEYHLHFFLNGAWMICLSFTNEAAICRYAHK